MDPNHTWRSGQICKLTEAGVAYAFPDREHSNVEPEDFIEQPLYVRHLGERRLFVISPHGESVNYGLNLPLDRADELLCPLPLFEEGTLLFPPPDARWETLTLGDVEAASSAEDASAEASSVEEAAAAERLNSMDPEG